MRISAAEEYGLRCLLQLARVGVSEQMSIPEIADAEGISVPYASKLLATLRRAGLVVAVRGRKGGFCIARDASDINILDVITTLGGPLIDPDHCSKRTGQLDICVHGEHCSVHDIIGGLAGYVGKFLSSTSLQDVIDGRIPVVAPPAEILLPMLTGPADTESKDAKESKIRISSR
ncbi:MAG: Rrf2 family transcriptional regulator [bacterium]